MATTHEHNNRTNQLNPNNRAYWQSRGYAERPSDWRDRSAANVALPVR